MHENENTSLHTFLFMCLADIICNEKNPQFYDFLQDIIKKQYDCILFPLLRNL